MKDKQEYIDVNDITDVDGVYYLTQNMSLVNGVVQTWCDNGQLETEGIYKDGKKDSVFKSWYEDGQLFLEGTFNNGRRNDVWKAYWENGRLKYESTHKNGELISDKKWDEDGNRKEK